MGTQQSDDTARALSDAGVPRHVIDYVARYRAIPIHRWFFVLLFAAVQIAGLSISLYFMSILNVAARKNARSVAASTDGILYHLSPGIWLIISIFGMLFPAFAIVGLTALLSRRAMVSFLF
ncbi:hypothetical protein [Ancylobacter sp.]|uniref:hypothetical protein n=1 Tax=Ancylobacter sp. TaxID=1872567 RepID=UPI003BAC5330